MAISFSQDGLWSMELVGMQLFYMLLTFACLYSPVL